MISISDNDRQSQVFESIGDEQIPSTNAEEKSNPNNFDQRIRLFIKEDKPYINKGPQLIDKDIHRSKCSLYLISSDCDPMLLKRASVDHYSGDSNFSDLPELQSRERDERLAILNKFRYNQLSSVMNLQIACDERLQMEQYKEKKVEVFQNELKYLNNRSKQNLEIKTRKFRFYSSIN